MGAASRRSSAGERRDRRGGGCVLSHACGGDARRIDFGDAGVSEAARRRRTEWERQRRLVTPLAIGRASLAEGAIAGVVNAVRTGGTLPPDAIVGQPASPGRATGPARIVRRAEDFDHFQPGEVLVARATTPAWTSLFGAPWRSLPTAAPSRPTRRWWLGSTGYLRWSVRVTRGSA